MLAYPSEGSNTDGYVCRASTQNSAVQYFFDSLVKGGESIGLPEDGVCEMSGNTHTNTQTHVVHAHKPVTRTHMSQAHKHT